MACASLVNSPSVKSGKKKPNINAATPSAMENLRPMPASVLMLLVSRLPQYCVASTVTAAETFIVIVNRKLVSWLAICAPLVAASPSAATIRLSAMPTELTIRFFSTMGSPSASSSL